VTPLHHSLVHGAGKEWVLLGEEENLNPPKEVKCRLGQGIIDPSIKSSYTGGQWSTGEQQIHRARRAETLDLLETEGPSQASFQKEQSPPKTPRKEMN